MSSTVFFGQTNHTNLEDHPILPVNTQLIKLIGVHAAVVYAALAEHMQLAGKSEGWLPISSISCLRLHERTGLAQNRIHKTLDRMEQFGILEMCYFGSRYYYRLLPIKDIDEIKDKRIALSHKTRPRRRSVPGAVAKPCA